MSSVDRQFNYQFYRTTAEAWDAMYEVILGAQKSIYWEVYAFLDDLIGNRFIEVLAAKAKAGVDVKLVIDSIGSRGLSGAAEKYFKDTGVELLWYNRLYPSFRLLNWYRRLSRRNHRKVLVIDEETAFLGGVNIGRIYQHWADLYIKIKGKVIRPLLWGFAKSYISAGGDKAKVFSLLHPKRRSWQEYKNQLRFLIHSYRFNQESPLKKIYIRALAMAQETINLVSPYFVPDKQFLRAMAKARARGVKVNLYLPLRPDVKAMELLARWYYRLAEKAGVKIYFFKDMNHSKGMTIDGKMGMVGSANLNRRSFWLDSEAGVIFTDEDMVRDLNAIFNDWQNNSTALNDINFVKLGPIEKFQQWLLRKLENYF